MKFKQNQCPVKVVYRSEKKKKREQMRGNTSFMRSRNEANCSEEMKFQDNVGYPCHEFLSRVDVGTVVFKTVYYLIIRLELLAL